MRIPIEELDIQYARSSGPGGQNVNKTNSKVIIRWNLLSSPAVPEAVKKRFYDKYSTKLTKEGEWVIMSDRFRDQTQNYKDCMTKMESILLSVWHPPKPRRKTKPSYSSKMKRLDSKQKHGEKKTGRGKKYDSFD